MSKTLKTGDKVRWRTSQGETEGEVIKKLTRTTKIKGHIAKATARKPEYLVKSTKTGKAAAHKAESLKMR